MQVLFQRQDGIQVRRPSARFGFWDFIHRKRKTRTKVCEQFDAPVCSAVNLRKNTLSFNRLHPFGAAADARTVQQQNKRILRNFGFKFGYNIHFFRVDQPCSPWRTVLITNLCQFCFNDSAQLVSGIQNRFELLDFLFDILVFFFNCQQFQIR